MKIYEGDTDTWTNRFYTYLAKGNTIDKSITYANSGSYTYPENIQTVRKYGTANVNIKTSKSVNNISLIAETENTEIVSNIKLNNKDISNKGIEIIKEKYNPYFDENNYILEETYSDGVYYIIILLKLEV